MTSRPAAPESETPEPETDVLLKARPALWEDWNSADLHALEMHARSLERRLAAALLDVEGHKAGEGCQHKRAEEAATALSLAQTEIKGHMRIEDDLKLQIKRLGENLACAQENFHVTNQAYVKADAERTQAQARIAELEKDAARYRWLRLHAKDRNVWQPINAPEMFDAAIDAALKDRA